MATEQQLIRWSIARRRPRQSHDGHLNLNHVSTISQNFPPRVIEACWDYRYDEELRSEPAELQRIYDELRIEAALITIVSVNQILPVQIQIQPG